MNLTFCEIQKTRDFGNHSHDMSLNRHTKLIVYLICILSDFIFNEEEFEFKNECHICTKDFVDTKTLLLHLGEHGLCYNSQYLLKLIELFLIIN